MRKGYNLFYAVTCKTDAYLRYIVMTESRTMAEGDAPQRNFAKKSVKRIGTGSKLRTLNRIPDHILQNESLNAAMANLPSNYNFEIPKTIWKIITEKVTVVALQFPEGLLMYACIIADIIECYSGAKVIILGDVTYGACCIDDYTSKKLGASLLVHYGHSCLVPVNVTSIKVRVSFVMPCIVMGSVVDTSLIHCLAPCDCGAATTRRAYCDL